MHADQVQNKAWIKKFAIIWTGQVFSIFGSGLVQFALVWWLTQITHSAVVLATATLVAILPDVLLAPFAGALVDRWNRKKVMILADGFIAFFTLVLAGLYYAGLMQIWMVYVILFLRALGGAFHGPAMTASTSLIVPEKHLQRVSGINQAIRGSLNIICPPLGAILIGVLPFYGVMAIDVVTALVAITCLFFVSIPQPDRKMEGMVTPVQVLKDVREGYRYLRNWPGAVEVVLVAAVVNFLLAPTGTLEPLLVTDYFKGGALQFGLMDSAFGLGVVAGGLLLGAWGGFKRKVYTSLLGIAGVGVGILLVGLTPPTLFNLALVAMALGGIMQPLANGPIMAIMQARVAPEMQGRVFAMISSLVMAMMPLSMVAAAPIAQVVGARGWFLIGGALTLLVAVYAFTNKRILLIEQTEIPETEGNIVTVGVSAD